MICVDNSIDLEWNSTGNYNPCCVHINITLIWTWKIFVKWWWKRHNAHIGFIFVANNWDINSKWRWFANPHNFSTNNGITKLSRIMVWVISTMMIPIHFSRFDKSVVSSLFCHNCERLTTILAYSLGNRCTQIKMLHNNSPKVNFLTLQRYFKKRKSNRRI